MTWSFTSSSTARRRVSYQCVPTPGHTPFTAQRILLSDSNPLPADKLWSCNALRGGCLDLCSFDPLTGQLTVTQSALDLIGPECGQEAPG